MPRPPHANPLPHRPAHPGPIARRGSGGGELILLTGPYAAQVTPPRVFSGLSIYAVLADATVSIGTVSSQILAGSMLFLSPYEVHCWRVIAPGGEGVKAVHLSPAAAKESLGDIAATDEPWLDRRSALLSSPALTRAFCEWHDTLAGDAAGVADLSVIATIYAQYGTGTRQPFANAREHRSVTRVLRYLHRHRPAELHFDHVSDLAELSPAHFSRLFKQGIGLAPLAYYKQVRLAWSRESLVAAAPVSTVAEAKGFSDQSHFTRDFSRVAAVPPGQFVRCLTHHTQRPVDESRT